jgi:hypothetical protein
LCGTGNLYVFSSSLLCRPSYVEAERMTQICTRCKNTYWVCERHLDQPWSDVLPNGCECGAGVPCPNCRPRASRLIRRIRGSAPAAAPLADVAKRPRRTRSIANASVQPLPCRGRSNPPLAWCQRHGMDLAKVEKAPIAGQWEPEKKHQRRR